mgnify:CR=1 FL=1
MVIFFFLFIIVPPSNSDLSCYKIFSFFHPFSFYFHMVAWVLRWGCTSPSKEQLISKIFSQLFRFSSSEYTAEIVNRKNNFRHRLGHSASNQNQKAKLGCPGISIVSKTTGVPFSPQLRPCTRISGRFRMPSTGTKAHTGNITPSGGSPIRFSFALPSTDKNFQTNPSQ